MLINLILSLYLLANGMIRLKNAFIIIKGNQTELSTIYFKEGKIVKIFTGLDNSIYADEEIDADGKVVFPGFIDPHVHFDDPGFTFREDFETGTRSAAAGGITMIIDMPCTSIPPVTTVENFNNKLNIVKNEAYVDFAFWGGVTPMQVESGEYKRSLAGLKEKGVVGVKFYTISGMEFYPRMPLSDMDKAFRILKELNLVCAVHSEDYYLIDYYSKYFQQVGRIDPLSWFEGRVYEAEPVAIWSVIGVTEKVRNKLHIVHLSTAEGLKAIVWAKDHGLDVTTETCPQYLLFTVDDLKTLGSILKTSPPVRREEDRIALWKGLSDGFIDFIATDHAAGRFPDEKSNQNIWKDYAGIPGAQLAASIIISHGYHSGRLTLEEIQKLMSENAAKRYGFYPNKGSLSMGADADFTILDIDKKWIVDPSKLESKGKYSVVSGKELIGKVSKTIIRGNLVYDAISGIVGERGFGRFIKAVYE